MKDMEKSKKRLKNAYNLKSVDRIPIALYTDEWFDFNGYEITNDCEIMLKKQLMNIELSLKIESDYIPFLEPWLGVIVFAEAFGCEIKWPDNGLPWAKPIISDPKQVNKIKKPKWQNSTIMRKVLETIEYFQKETKGKYPLAITDSQSPLGTAVQIWNPTDFYSALITNPREVHLLLDIITDLFIEFTQKQIESIDNQVWPGHTFPAGEDNKGLAISDDLLAILSPELYKEYAIPYNTIISENFNGISIHSCGNFMHNIDNVLQIPKVLALNFHCNPKEMDPFETMNKLSGKVAVFADLGEKIYDFQQYGNDANRMISEYFIPGILSKGSKGVIIGGFLGQIGDNAYEQRKKEFDVILQAVDKISAENNNFFSKNNKKGKI